MEVTAAVAVVATVASAVYTKKSVDDQRKQIKAQRAADQKQYDLDVAQSKLTLAEEQRKNRNLLRQQQSAYRAKLGAAGMSRSSGTGRAVLDSLQREHDIEDKYLIDQANISLEALLNGINSKNSRNLLSLSQLDSRLASNTAGAISSLTSTAGRAIIK